MTSSPASRRMTRQQFLGAVAAASCAVAAGCRPGGPTAEPAAPKQATTSQKLRLLVIDDPTLGQTIARQWLAHTESEIEVQSATAADIADARRLPGDIVIFAAAMLAELAERGLVVPLQDEMLAGDDFARQDIFEHVRRHEVNWGRKTFAVPLGSPQLLLLYRSDLFEKRSLQPPASWDDYQSAAAVLAEEKPAGDDAAWQATCEPLADGWAGQTLLARAAGYVLHPNQVSPLFEYDSLEPLIAGPAFVRALEELIAAAKPGKQEKRLTPGEAYAEMLAGRCGMAITWPHNAPQPAAADAKAALPAGVVRCAQLPGASEVYNQSAKTGNRGPRATIAVPCC